MSKSDTPSAFTWCLAGTSVFLVFSLLYGGNLVVGGLKLAHLQAEFRAEMANDRASHTLLANAKLQPLIQLGDRSVRRSIDLLGAIEEEKYAAAAEILQTTGIANPYLARELNKNLRDLVDLALVRERRSEELAVQERREVSLAVEYSQVRSQLKQMFQLPPDDPPKNLESREARERYVAEEMKFYQQGVLIGLPVLREIPEKISSWDELRQILVATGPEIDKLRLGVQLSSAVDDLKLRMEPFQGSFAVNQKLLADSREAFDAADRGAKRVRQRTLTYARNNLFELARPNVSPLRSQVYSEVRSIAGRYGFVFPELFPRAAA